MRKTNIRLWLCCLISCLAWFQSRAQSGNEVVVSVIIPPPYSPYLQDYLQYENKMVIQLQNTTTQTLSLKLIGSIEGDNGISLRTDADYLPASPVTLLPGALLRIPASSRSRSFLDPDNLIFEGPGDLETQILKDGILPEGLYNICIRAVDYNSNLPLSQEDPAGCALLPISYPTPPQLVSPECEGISDDRMPFFQWTLPGGNTGNAALQYDLFIVEWLRGTNPQDLMQLAVDYHAGNAIVKRNLTSPAYQYQPHDIRLLPGKTYLWAVKVRDRMMKVTFENNGLSEICSFTIGMPEEDNNDIFITHSSRPELQIVQHRTLIKGQLNYKFPGATSVTAEMVNRNLSPGTGSVGFSMAEENPYEFGSVNDQFLALTPKNYLDAFPVSKLNSKPLKSMTVKLIEGWVIMDCNVTYNPGGYTEHKDFFIVPDDRFRPMGHGGHSLHVTIDGITDTGGENSLQLGTGDFNAVEYSRVLAVDRTDENGNYSMRFTQSTPGFHYINYRGSASVFIGCDDQDIPEEHNDWVHPLDLQSNPADIYTDPQDLVSSPEDIVGNPSDIVGNPANIVNNAVDLQSNMWGDPHLGDLGGNTSLRSGSTQTPPGQQAYNEVIITGGRLMKVLRLEVSSPFYYSPDLIFWTHPGDTLELPDQVSYVKSFDLDMTVIGGQWESGNYQYIDLGLPVEGLDVLVSRRKEGLPREIPMEEGQALRDYEGEESNGLGLSDINDMMEGIGDDDNDYDSVSIKPTEELGTAFHKKLVAGHPYYIEGATPKDGIYYYRFPMTTKLYEVYETSGCDINLSSTLNSFCQHKPIYIQDTLIAFPLRPRVFGRTVTTTDDDKEPLPQVRIRLKRIKNNQVVESYETFSDEYGHFTFDNLSVDDATHTDYNWKIYFSINGYSDVVKGPEAMKPGRQWDLEDVRMFPLGNLTGYIRDEDGKVIQALVRLADGPHVQTTLGTAPSGTPELCGTVNGFGDGINEASQIFEIGIADVQMHGHISNQAAKFELPAQSGNNRRLVIIPLPEQYYQDTCYVDVENISQDEFQQVGYITVKEKLHRIIFAVKGPQGQGIQARIRVDELVRETGDLGFAAFRFASPEAYYRVRVEPDAATWVPIDTIMHIPISKEYLSHTFHLKEGRKLKIQVILDQSGYEQQSNVPIPIAGAIVQTLLSTSSTGNNYIQCITGADGVCTLEGVPTSSSTVDVAAWKEDEGRMYIGKTVAVSTSRPLNPPFVIALKSLSNVTVPDIWGFPTAITDMEIKAGSGGKMDTLLKGHITELPENSRFKSKEDVQIPYPKIKFKYSGRRADDGRRIMEPVNSGITFQQTAEDIVLYDEFDVTLKPKRSQGLSQIVNLSLTKVGQSSGKIEGVVETELSSFNWSYDFDGKFFLGKTPTEYNIEVFQTGTQIYMHQNIGQALQMDPNAEPEPGPNDFYLMDIGPGNKPISHQYQVWEFPASSDSSRSFVSTEGFYIHTILHTNISNVTPSDLELSVGKIIVTPDEITTFNNGTNRLDFRMGKLWRYRSTSPFHYDPDLGGITVSTGFIQTGQIDVPVNDPIVYYDHLVMSHVDAIESLTLSGIKTVTLMDGVNVVLSQGDMNIGWQLTVQREDEGTDGIVAEITNLPPLRPQDKISIETILLNSEDSLLDLTVHGDVRPYDIADYTVTTITTGPGFFILGGNATLGRPTVRVPNLMPTDLGLRFRKVNNALVGEFKTSYTGLFETYGQVSFKFDANDGNSKRQHWENKHFVSTGLIRVYEDGGEFTLKGILEVNYNDVKIHVIHEDLDHDDIHLDVGDIDYTKVDQQIELGGSGKKLMVRYGLQEAASDAWLPLTFDANMDGFEGVNATQPPLTMVVTGDINASNEEIKVDNINLGFATIGLTYDFEQQLLFGQMNFESYAPPIIMGPVTVNRVEAQILIDPNGFLFAANLEGTITAAFPAKIGMLVGAHSNIPNGFIELAMKDAKYSTPPNTLADHELNGFFITGRVDLIDAPMTEYNFLVFKVKGGAAVGFDARVYMDFGGQNDESAFGFGALAFAEAMISATIYVPPPPFCTELTMCLRGELKLLLEAELHTSGGNWEVSGHGCGSLRLEAALCELSDDVEAKVDILFSSAHDPEISAELGASCGDNGESSQLFCN